MQSRRDSRHARLLSRGWHGLATTVLPASALAALGKKAKFGWKKDVAERALRSTQYSANPVWDDLRDDLHFAALIRKVEQSKMD
jgi:hypothetical protein